MVEVVFMDQNGGLEYEEVIPEEVLRFLMQHKPPIDLDGYGWKIVEFRFHVERKQFVIFVEKES